MIDQYHCHIIDICSGRTGNNQAFRFLKGVVGVILPKYFADINSLLSESFRRSAVCIASCSIRGSICTITAHAEYAHIRNTVNLNRCRKG